MAREVLLSIVTVVYNDKTIVKTIESILPFIREEVELIVIDGKSTDGTYELLKQYANKILLISEPDHGIYDAINKGVSNAKGTYILHINAGDYLMNLPLKQLKEERNNKNVAALSFPVLSNNKKIFYPYVNWKIKIKNTLHHQGTFYRREYDHYDTNYKVFADTNLNKQLYIKGLTIKVYKEPCIANHLWNGISTTSNNRKEWYCTIINNFGYKYLIVYFIYRILDLFLCKSNKI